MPTRKTNNEFVTELNAKNPLVLPLDSYTNSVTKIECECKQCGNKWFAAPGHLLAGKGCPVCSRKSSANKRSYTQKQFIEKINAVHPEIEVIGNYVNSNTKIKVCCHKCRNTWDVTPASLLYGTGCPKCHKRYRRNTQEFREELKAISPHITVLGEYKNAQTKIRVRCERCGTEWSAVANALLKGNDCPFCSHAQTSVAEQVLYNAFVCLLGKEKVISRDKSTIGKELDLIVPDLNLAIEYGAWYWHANRLQNDYEKESLCSQRGIRLVTIYEGCPESAKPDPLNNAVCYSSVLSNEKDYATLKSIILNLCQEYNLCPTIIENDWKTIIKKAREESRRKDALAFSAELSHNYPTIEYLHGYSGSKNRVFVMCKTCGNKWYASSAYDLLHGHGCPVCAIKQRNTSQQTKPDEFKKRIFEINPNIELLEDYSGASQKLLCRCKICGYEWKADPVSIRYKTINCPNCSPVTKKTNDRFLEELAKVSASITPLEPYKNNRSRIRFKCTKCGYEWLTTPHTILHGCGCPKCTKHIAFTPEEFKERIQSINGSVELLEPYRNKKTKIRCRCKKCGYEWLGMPDNLMNGAGCQRCAGTLRLTNEEFLRRLSLINPQIHTLEKYVNGQTKLLFQCDNCHNTWKAVPRNILNGHGCPFCKAEKARLLKSKKVKCIETGVVYDSISIAKKATGITTISDCLNKRTLSAGGFHWEYV